MAVCPLKYEDLHVEDPAFRIENCVHMEKSRCLVRVPKKTWSSALDGLCETCCTDLPSPCPTFVCLFALCTCALEATCPFIRVHVHAFRGHIFSAAFKNLALILDQFTVPMKRTCKTYGANSIRLSGLHSSGLICDFSLHSHSCGSPR